MSINHEIKEYHYYFDLKLINFLRLNYNFFKLMNFYIKKDIQTFL